MNSYNINKTVKSNRFLSRSDLRYLAMAFAIQILANLIMLFFFWEDRLEKSLNKYKHIDAEILDQYVTGQISRELPAGTLIIPYRFMSPENPAKGQKYPLLVFLHGAGSRGTDNIQQLESLPSQLAKPTWRKKYACYVLVPQCPPKLWWGRWQVTDQVAELLHKMVQANPQIDPNRIYLTGLSMGGNGCWSLAGRHPDLFAGIAIFCGQGNPHDAPAMVSIPFWVVHGNADEVIDVSYSREMVDALEKVNATVVYQELDGVGHNCWQKSFQDPSQMMDWIFQQNRHLSR